MAINIKEAIKFPLSNKDFRNIFITLLILDFITSIIPSISASSTSILCAFKTAFSVLLFRSYANLDTLSISDVNSKNINRKYAEYFKKTCFCDLLWLFIIISIVLVINFIGSSCFHYNLADILKTLIGSYKGLLILLFLSTIPLLLAVNMGLFVSFSADAKFWDWFNFKRMFLFWKNHFLALIVLVLINFIFYVSGLFLFNSVVISALYTCYSFSEAVILAQIYKEKSIF